MRKHEEHEIKGLRLTIGQVPPMRAYPLANRVAALLAPAIAELDSNGGDVLALAKAIAAEDVNGALAAVEIGTLASAIGAALAKAQGDDARNLMREAFAATSVIRDGRKYDLTTDEMINAAFEGRGAWTINRALALAIKVNFTDFGEGAPEPDSAGAPKASR